MTTSVLLTLGRLPKALEIARAFDTAGCRVIVAEPLRWHVCKPSSSVASTYKVTAPNVDLDSYLRELLNIIMQEDIDLVVPISEEAVYVSLLHGRLPSDVRLACPLFEQMNLLNNKLSFADWAIDHGLSVPPTFAATTDEASELASRKNYVLKPSNGYSGVGVKLRHKGEILDAREPGLIVQEQIQGRHMSSLSLLKNGNDLCTVLYEGRVFADTVAVCSQRIDVLPRISEWIKKFALAGKLTGFFALDFILDEQEIPWVIECNPRVTSGIHFFDNRSTANALLNPQMEVAVTLKRSPARYQWSYSTLTEVWRSVFQPKEFLRKFKELINARDAVWDINDPWPFILMMPMSSEIMWKAMTSSMTLGEVSQLDIAWIPKLEEE